MPKYRNVNHTSRQKSPVRGRMSILAVQNEIALVTQHTRKRQTGWRDFGSKTFPRAAKDSRQVRRCHSARNRIRAFPCHQKYRLGSAAFDRLVEFRGVRAKLVLVKDRRLALFLQDDIVLFAVTNCLESVAISPVIL